MAVAPAVIGALGSLGSAALTAPPQTNQSSAASDAYMGGVSAPFGDVVVYGGGEVVPMAAYTNFSPVIPGGVGGPAASLDKTTLIIIGGVLLWLFLKK